MLHVKMLWLCTCSYDVDPTHFEMRVSELYIPASGADTGFRKRGVRVTVKN